MSIYVNRTLNLKNIQIIGLDMDYTLVRYQSEKFEEMTFREMIRKLIECKNYPSKIIDFNFHFNQIIRGLVFDKKRGNLLKLCRYGKVKCAFHGTSVTSFQEMQKVYKGLVIDLNDKQYAPIDTIFSISSALLFLLLVDYKDHHNDLPQEYEEIYNDIIDVLDRSHNDNSLKGKVVANPSEYLIQDSDAVKMLKDFKESGKKVMLITNSDFFYTKELLKYTIDPFLGEGESWTTFFDLVITLAEKPKFFFERRRMLKVDVDSGLLNNLSGPLRESGVYQGGSAEEVSKYFNVNGDQIFYLGDHIFGDILQLKKSCNWRTGLVIEELVDEVVAIGKGRDAVIQIDDLMKRKEELELKLFDNPQKDPAGKKLLHEIKDIDQLVSAKISFFESLFNPYWGPMLRSGQEESRLMSQIQKYACVYMTKLSDLAAYSPRHYFRPKRRPLPHEMP